MPVLHTTSIFLGISLRPGSPLPGALPNFSSIRITSRPGRIAVGGGTVDGDVLELTTPKPNAIVRLYDRETGLLVQQTVTDGAGLYVFKELDARRRYYALALDDQPGGYNAAIADYVQP